MKYGVQGFPTVVVFDSEGKPLGALGYQAGGPQAFIAQLEKLRKG
jgi:thioredoxin-related protein